MNKSYKRMMNKFIDKLYRTSSQYIHNDSTSTFLAFVSMHGNNVSIMERALWCSENRKFKVEYSLYVNGGNITNTLTFWQRHKIKVLFKKLKKIHEELRRNKKLEKYCNLIEDMLYLEE